MFIVCLVPWFSHICTWGGGGLFLKMAPKHSVEVPSSVPFFFFSFSFEEGEKEGSYRVGEKGGKKNMF